MVAPSFQSYKVIVAEPFLKNGKLYITVEHPNTKNHRDVRWYTEKEYQKAYPSSQKTSKPYPNGLMNARGFSKGPILLIRNNRPDDEEWLKLSPACFATDFGWHIRSTETLPNNAPSHFRYCTLSWDEIKDPSDPTNNTTLPKEERNKIISRKVRQAMV
jgi:hypothetical protein